MERLQAAFGLFALLAIAAALSENRRAIDWRRAGLAFAASIAAALLFLKVPFAAQALGLLNVPVQAVADATRAGTSFVFGYLGGGLLPFAEASPGGAFVLALQALPLILVVSALTTLLFHWGVLPKIVRALSFVLERSLGVGGAVGLSTAANVFVGMVEAPLFIRPYLARLTRGELFVVMVGGMASIAGTVMVLYATIVGRVVPDAFGHILVASLLSAPVTILIGRIMVPDAAATRTAATLDTDEPVAASAMDAIAKGTSAGLELLLNIVAMLIVLIVLIALVALANSALGLLPDVFGAKLTLERALGWVMAPICWLMGISWAEAATAGALMGVKTVLNEFVAYVQLADTPAEALSERARLILVYALCGFANFGSLGIMIGGLATIAPQRRAEIVALGMKSLVAGTLATCFMGALVGALY
jgi:CNT family concentrative nucleoside transporter